MRLRNTCVFVINFLPFFYILERNVNYLFPIQYKTFDHIYNGEDVIGQARK